MSFFSKSKNLEKEDNTTATDNNQPTSIYDFNVPTGYDDNNEMTLKESKLQLIVNVASAWGLTKQNYKELEILRERYASKGLMISGFPCNQFGGQEPGTYDSIIEFVTNKMKVDLSIDSGFIMYGKIDVNGNDTHPLFSYLKSSLPGLMGTTSIKWNFGKFLCVNGQPYKRYGSKDSPLSFEKDIIALLDEES